MANSTRTAPSAAPFDCLAAIRAILDTRLLIEICHTGRLHYEVRFENEETGDGVSSSGMTLVEALRNAVGRRGE